MEIQDIPAARLDIGDTVAYDGVWLVVDDIERTDVGEGIDRLDVWLEGGHETSVFSIEYIVRKIF